MASLIYDSFWSDLFANSINPLTDTIKGMLVTSTYAPNKGTHSKRSNVTNEVTGTGYTAGGATMTVTANNNITTHVLGLHFADVQWASSTITARALVIYKSRGGASSADELLAYVDFGGNVVSVGSLFKVTFVEDLLVNNA